MVRRGGRRENSRSPANALHRENDGQRRRREKRRKEETGNFFDVSRHEASESLRVATKRIQRLPVKQMNWYQLQVKRKKSFLSPATKILEERE